MTDSGAGALGLLLAGLALLVLPDAPALRVRRPAVARVRPMTPVRRRAAVVAGGVVALGVLTGVAPWWAVAVTSVAAGWFSTRLGIGRSAAEQAADRQALAVHADLFAACLDSGMPVVLALQALSTEPQAGRSFDPLQALNSVAAMLALGADPAVAWQPADSVPELAALAAAARRSAVGGVGLADAAREHAAHLRREAAAQAQRRAGRAGVSMTAPLGLCFLPAFVCLGLAPVIIGLLGTLGVF